jgi:hypothetical protein
VLADHALRCLVGDAIVVVRDRAARRDHEIPDPVGHVRSHLAEQTSHDQFDPRHHPGPRTF